METGVLPIFPPPLPTRLGAALQQGLRKMGFFGGEATVGAWLLVIPLPGSQLSAELSPGEGLLWPVPCASPATVLRWSSAAEQLCVAKPC